MVLPFYISCGREKPSPPRREEITFYPCEEGIAFYLGDSEMAFYPCEEGIAFYPIS